MMWWRKAERQRRAARQAAAGAALARATAGLAEARVLAGQLASMTDEEVRRIFYDALGVTPK